MNLSVIRDRLERLKKGQDIQEILAKSMSPHLRKLIWRCAVVRTFDKALLHGILRSIPDPIAEGDISTESLLASTQIEQVPWADVEYRVIPAERATLLNEWEKESDAESRRKLSVALVDYYRKRDELEWLYHLPSIQPNEALQVFQARCSQAEQAYQLARYEDLISLFEGRKLGPSIDFACQRLRARLNALALWADEYYRTGRYLERSSLIQALGAVIGMATELPASSEVDGKIRPWVLQLHAAGGSGKTMFVRWCIARWCVFERSIPCARIDFDDRRNLALARNPEQLAGELARQWSRQLVGHPHLYIATGTPDAFPLRSLGLKLTTALPAGTPVLLVLDTLEEILIAHRATLLALLRQVEKLRENCPRLVLILSGRYDLGERLKDEEYGMTGQAALDMPVVPFNPVEAQDYLVRLRGLAAADPRIPAIVKRADGNPLKLSLYVEVLEAEPEISAKMIEEDRRVDLAYLIRRVVNHIPDLKLRWVLRYGVVANSLTPAFMTEVLAEPLRQELWTRTHDYSERGLPNSLQETNPFPRIPGVADQDIEIPGSLDLVELWRELKQFASSASWVREEGEVLIFSPDVLTPMRGLLLEQEESVFIPLHRRALAYFRRKAQEAEALKQDPMPYWRQMLFHDFQQRGEQAGQDWRTLLLSNSSPAWRKALAEEVVGRDYVSDDDPPTPLERKNGARMIAPADLIFAYFQLARALVDQGRVVSAVDAAWSEASEAFDRLDKFDPNTAADPQIALLRGELALHDARDYLGRQVEAERAHGQKTADLALQALARAIGNGDRQSQIAALWLRADFLAEQGQREAISDYNWLETLLGFAEEQPDLQKLRESRARVNLAFDKYSEALADAAKAFQEALLRGIETEAAQLDLLCRELFLRSGRPLKATRWRQRAIELGQPTALSLETWEDSFGFVKARARLALLDPHGALELHRDARKQWRKSIHNKSPGSNLLLEKPEQREQRAEIAIALKHYQRANEELGEARAEWKKLGQDENSYRVLASMVGLSLYELENLIDVAEELSLARNRGDVTRSEPALSLEFMRVDFMERTGRVGEALALLEQLFNQLGPDTPPRFRVKAALCGLTRQGSIPQQPYVTALIQGLAEITPKTARAALLGGLKRCPPLIGVDPALTQDLLDVLPSVDEPTLSTRERGLTALIWVEALRILGRKEEAAHRLDEARRFLLEPSQTHYELIHRPPNASLETIQQFLVTNYFPVPLLLSAEDRLNGQREATARGRELLPRFASEYNKDHERDLCISAWLDQAERAMVVQDSIAADEAITEVRRRLERLESAWSTLFSARFFAAQAKRQEQLGYTNEETRFREIAFQQYYKKLGITDLSQDHLHKEAQTSVRSIEAMRELSIAPSASQPPITHIKSWVDQQTFSLSISPQIPPPGNPEEVFAELTAEQITILGLSFSDISTEGTAPFEVLKRFDQSWEDFAQTMTEILFPAPIHTYFDVRMQEESPKDFRLLLTERGLAPLPWEFLLRPGENTFLADSGAVRHVYRSFEFPASTSLQLPWLQQALRELADHGLRGEEVESSRFQQAVKVVQSEEGLEPTGFADGKTRWKMDNRLRERRGNPPRVAILVTARRAGYGDLQSLSSQLLALILLYERCGFEVIVKSSEEELLDPSLKTQLIGKTLGIIHLSAELSEAPSLGVYFDLKPRFAGEIKAPSQNIWLTSRSFDSFLRMLPETELKPLVILDPPRPSARFDAVRQLFLRNAFAAELYRLGNAPAVLGMGLSPDCEGVDKLLENTVIALTMGHSVGAAADQARQAFPSKASPTLNSLLSPIGTTLFAHDPDSRVPGADAEPSSHHSSQRSTTMSRTIHALLVGIDAYPAPIPALSGCVNDIEFFATYLEERVSKDKGVALHLKTLKNAEATREVVIKSFREHFGSAKTGDVALFYYSGHGSQEPAPEEFWAIEADHLDETLVCYDSRTPGGWDLADKEIAKLIAEVAAKGPHVATILDCCHSGSGTRDAAEAVVRRVETDKRRRPIESFILSTEEVQATATRSRGQAYRSCSISNEGRHVLLAACASDQEAKEYSGNGQRRGAFSFFLGEALNSANGIPTYRDLYARTTGLVSTHLRNQSPQLEASRIDDLDAVFLDGVIQPTPATYTASADKNARWLINGGAAHGIPPAVGEDTTRLALFRFDASAADLGDVSKAVATARVVEVLPVSSLIDFDGNVQLDLNTTYKALILSLPTPAVVFSLEGDPMACDLIAQSVATASPAHQPSSFIRVAHPGETSAFRLVSGTINLSSPTPMIISL